MNLLPPMGTLRLANMRPEPVEIVVDGAQVIPVAPGQTLDVPNIVPGNHALAGGGRVACLPRVRLDFSCSQ